MSSPFGDNEVNAFEEPLRRNQEHHGRPPNVPRHDDDTGEVTAGRLGTGLGTDSKITFTPQQWADRSGLVGYAPHEVLMHELVHSVFTMNGKSNSTPLRGTMRSYHNLNEWYAVLITNVFCSELGRPLLNDYSNMPKLLFYQHNFLQVRQHRRWIEHMFAVFPRLCFDLSSIRG